MVQWLRLHAPNAGGPGSTSGQGTRSHMCQPRVPMPQLKILQASTKSQHSKINNFFKKEIELATSPQFNVIYVGTSQNEQNTGLTGTASVMWGHAPALGG